MLIWNEKDSVKYGYFLTKANLSAICLLEPLLQISRGTKTNYVIIGPSGYELSREPFIRAVRVLYKP